MSHPLVPQLMDLATPLAQQLGLEVIAIVFQTNKRPPVLRVDIRHQQQDTGLQDCEAMSRALEAVLEEQGIISSAYVLEVSSPGIARELTSDREFISFRGFAVLVTTSEPYENQSQWRGNLIKRDEEYLYLNQKGRTISIPRTLVVKVQIDTKK